jgi:hypothetical protein
MAVSHIFTSPVADFTGTVTVFDSNGQTATTNATALVRPSNWNSVHNQFVTISGNTAGASTASGTNLVLQGGNNVTLSVTDQTIIFSASQSQSVQTQGMVSVQGSTGAITFVNSNGITFGGNASTITASHNGLTSQSVQTQSNVQGISAGTQVGRTGDIVLSDSNGISFGMSGSTRITASYTVPSTAGLLSNIKISAGTLSNNLSALTFADSNGISFGLNGSVITGSHNALTSQSNQAASNSAGSFTFQTLNFSNANNVTFGTSAGGIITASVAPAGAATLTVYAVSNTTQSTSGTIAGSVLSFQGNGGVSAGVSNGSVVISGPDLTSLSVTGALSASSNGSTISLGVGTVTMSATGNTTQASSGTVNLNALVMQGTGGVSVGVSNGSIVISGNTGGGAGYTAGVSTGGNTSGDTGAVTGRLVLAGGNNITLSGSTNGGSMTLTISGANAGGAQTGISGVGVSDTTYTSGTIIFSNQANITIGSSVNGASQYVRLSGNPAQTNQTVGLYALGNTTQNSSTTLDARTLSLNALGAMTAGYSNGSIQLSAPATSSLVAGANITISTAGSTITIIAGTAAPSPVVISAGTQSSSLSNIVFSDSNGVSFGLSNGTITATVATNYAASNHSHGNPTLALTNLTGTTASASNGLTLSLAADPAFSAGISGGNTSGDTGTRSNQVVFAGGNNITLSGSTNAGGMSVTISGPNVGGAQTGISGIVVSNTTYTSGTVTFQNANGISFGSSGANGISASYTVPTQTAQTVGLYASSQTTGQSSSSTVDARSITIVGQGNISVGLSGGSFLISQTGGANVAFSADASSTFQTLTFQNSNNVSFSNNAGAIRITHNLAGTSTGSQGANVGISMTHNSSGLNLSITAPAQTNQTGGIYFTAQTTGQSSSSTYDLRTLSVVGDGIVSAGWSNGTVRISATQSNQAFSAGAASSTFQTIIFQDSNGVSFSNNAGSIRVTHGLAGTGTSVTGLASMTLNSAGLAFNGTGLAGTGTTFAGANISASITMNSAGLNLSASVAAPGAAAENNAINMLGANTAGNTTATGSTIGWSGLNVTLSGTNNSQIVISAPATSSLAAAGNVSISTNGSTITISGVVPQVSRWQNIMNGPGRTDSALNWQAMGTAQSSLYVMPLDMDGGVWQGNMTVSTVFVNMSGSISGAASTAAKTLSMFLGLYTENNSSLSLLNSVSASVGSGGANANMTASFNGPRLFSAVSSAWSAQPVLVDGSAYFLGYMIQSAGESFALSWRGLYGVSGQASGTMGSSIAATNTTMKTSPWRGVYTAQTAGLPTVISQAHLRGTASNEVFVPAILFENRLSSF